MARVKTTLMVDDQLLRQVRVRAARTGKRDSDIMDEVLREGLGVLERLRAAAQVVDEEEVLDLASSVVHEIRADKARRPSDHEG